VQPVSTKRHVLLRLHDGNSRGAGEQFGEHALVLWRQVLHEHEGEAAIGRYML
jgi:hypothetical protein